jgi:large subunit ribosomal protein L30
MDENTNTGTEKPTIKAEVKPEVKLKVEKKVKQQVELKGKVAVILVRSTIHIRHDMKKTLRLLNLFNQHNCVILDNNNINLGMLKKVKDFVTYGLVSDETISLLQKKNKIKEKTYKLSPPRGGFERKGIKMPYKLGGALGPRNNMDMLIKKMI